MTHTKKAWINGLFFLATLIINTLGAIGLINGLTQKEISDRYMTLITPSPATFSIWSVIYTFLLISVIAMILRKNDAYYRKAVDRISGLFRISSLLNIAWIVAFSFVQIELSLIFIFGFVITLALICQKLLALQEGKRWLLPLSFGLYTGWLMIATVVNTAAALVKIQWNGFGLSPELWGVLILGAAVLIMVLVITQIKNAVFPLPVAWAYFGIYQFLSAPEGFNGAYGLLPTAALVGMALLIGLAAIQFYKNRLALLPASPGTR